MPTADIRRRRARLLLPQDVTCLWSFIRAELESSLLIPLLLGVEQ